jgi:hypothetical protein
MFESDLAGGAWLLLGSIIILIVIRLGDSWRRWAVF